MKPGLHDPAEGSWSRERGNGPRAGGNGYSRPGPLEVPVAPTRNGCQSFQSAASSQDPLELTQKGSSLWSNQPGLLSHIRFCGAARVSLVAPLPPLQQPGRSHGCLFVLGCVETSIRTPAAPRPPACDRPQPMHPPVPQT